MRLQQLGHDNWVMLERSEEAGGLARSTTDSKGFIWDMGGHVIFSHYKYFDEVFPPVQPQKKMKEDRSGARRILEDNGGYPLKETVILATPKAIIKVTPNWRFRGRLRVWLCQSI